MNLVIGNIHIFIFNMTFVDFIQFHFKTVKYKGRKGFVSQGKVILISFLLIFILYALVSCLDKCLCKGVVCCHRVLGIEPETAGRTANVLNHGAELSRPKLF